MTDLSKAFECPYHNLLTAELHACGFDKNALKLVYTYIKEREQRVEIDNTYSEWDKIIFGAP